MATANYPIYVRSLQRERAEAVAELAALRAGIGELVGYLTSSKFQEWPYVNAADVLHRLQETNAVALLAGVEADQPDGRAA